MTQDQKSKKIRADWIQIDALQCGTGWTERDLKNPQILVESAYGESHPGSFHLDALAEEVSIAIYQEGGKPAKFYGTDICDGWAQMHEGMNYILPSRETLCDLVEIHGRVIPWDGVAVISSCDKSIPAHLMAISRLNIPAIHVPGGSNRIGPNMSHSILPGGIATRTKRGQDFDTQIRDYRLSGCPGTGACQFMGTASTMQCMAEALGLTLPGAALTPASLFDIRRFARRAGWRLMDLAKKGIRPSDILTEAAFENAIKIHAAISGSTNALLHLPAIAHEIGLAIDAEWFDRLHRQTPYLVDIQPSGRFLSELFWYAGGVPRVQTLLRDMLDLDVMTVTGKTLGDNLKQIKRKGFFRRGEGYLGNYGLKFEEVIHSPDECVCYGSVALLKGNIAPEGAVIKYSAVEPDMLEHVGPARVFDSEEDALSAIIDQDIEPGSVIVLRYEGPCGGGMPEILATTEALVTSASLQKTAIVTDGRFSGATRGPCIGHVSPEAARGGPIALVEDGDLILIDIPKRNLSIVGRGNRRMGTEAVQSLLEKRRKRWKAPSLNYGHGILERYAAHVVSAMKGAYLEVAK